MMVIKQTKRTTPAKRNPKKIISRVPLAGENENEAHARDLITPTLGAAACIQDYSGGGDLAGLVYALEHEIKQVSGGDMSRPEGMLVAQAHTLDMIFNTLVLKASHNLRADYLEATDRLMRLALKAQSQSRSTLEALAEIKNPRPVAFVKQANFANGPQQVNNGSMPEASRARENENQQDKLLEKDNGEWMDARTAGAAVGINPEMATVGEINGAENC